MKQILQHLNSGKTEVAEVATPAVAPGHLKIRTSRTLISSGTERMLLDFGRAGLLGKARQQPEKVQEVLNKIRTDGLLPTLDAVRNKLDQPLPLGYCNAGTVIAVGPGVEGFQVGDRVASNGPHAEVVSVPSNLCAVIPPGVTDEEAAFTVLASIALQGIRLMAPTLGETIVVTGLGLIGLLSVQILRAGGCQVIGLDFDSGKLELARSFGAAVIDLKTGVDPVNEARQMAQGRGVDGVLLTAATKSDDPVSQAARMCRKRGRVVLVGVTGLNLNRADFYKNEISFQVSCSYGPGRYDPQYEDKGVDYPLGFVRWTEQRNFEAILGLMSRGSLDVSSLISQRFGIDEAEKAYDTLAEDKAGLGLVIEYDQEHEPASVVELDSRPVSGGQPTLSFIGSGAYAGRILIPAFAASGAELMTVVSRGGVSSAQVGKKLGFRKATTDVQEVLSDKETRAVVITTRHDQHADLVCRALEAGKHVFVEKPLAMTTGELDAVESALDGARVGDTDEKPLLMVGFNRRFSPQVQKMKQLVQSVAEPKAFSMTVNAGHIPGEHWTQDPEVGGGRIIGEGCHFIDLLRFLAGSPIAEAQVLGMPPLADDIPRTDVAMIQLKFADGSIGSVHYLANGHKSFPKERLEVFAAGGILQLDNFVKMRGFGWPGFRKQNLWKQDKGQEACAAAFVRAIEQGEESPIPVSELFEVARVTIDLAARA